MKAFKGTKETRDYWILMFFSALKKIEYRATILIFLKMRREFFLTVPKVNQEVLHTFLPGGGRAREALLRAFK